MILFILFFLVCFVENGLYSKDCINVFMIMLNVIIILFLSGIEEIWKNIILKWEKFVRNEEDKS